MILNSRREIENITLVVYGWARAFCHLSKRHCFMLHASPIILKLISLVRFAFAFLRVVLSFRTNLWHEMAPIICLFKNQVNNPNADNRFFIAVRLLECNWPKFVGLRSQINNKPSFFCSSTFRLSVSYFTKTQINFIDANCIAQLMLMISNVMKMGF